MIPQYCFFAPSLLGYLTLHLNGFDRSNNDFLPVIWNVAEVLEFTLQLKKGQQIENGTP